MKNYVVVSSWHGIGIGRVDNVGPDLTQSRQARESDACYLGVSPASFMLLWRGSERLSEDSCG